MIGSADFAFTPSGTPEDSIPTTTSTSTEAISSFDRLRLQRQPWVSYLQTNKFRFILSGVFLLIQLFLDEPAHASFCRLQADIHRLLSYQRHHQLVHPVGVQSGSPPYLASKSSIPCTNREKENSAGQTFVVPATAVAKRTVDVAPEELHLGVWDSISSFCSVPDPATFAIAAAFLYALGFAFAWLLIPQAPPFLATPDGLAVQGVSSEMEWTKF